MNFDFLNINIDDCGTAQETFIENANILYDLTLHITIVVAQFRIQCPPIGKAISYQTRYASIYFDDQEYILAVNNYYVLRLTGRSQ